MWRHVLSIILVLCPLVSVSRADCVSALAQLNENLRTRGYFVDSEVLQSVLQRALAYAPLDENVLITGESGVGKEMLARILHESNPTRSKHQLVILNSATADGETVNSHLFGHERGAFTGAVTGNLGLLAAANRGTLFIDEVADLPMSVQAKLLRFINSQTHERAVLRVGATQETIVNVRIIAATNVDLRSRVEEGTFRSDLYYRLNVIRLDVPPLRVQRNIIPALANHFLKVASERFDKQFLSLSKDAADHLSVLQWEGNVRDLEEVIKRSVIDGGGNQTIMTRDMLKFDPEVRSYKKGLLKMIPDGRGDLLERAEALILREALELNNGVQKKAAEILGVAPRVVNYKLRQYEIKYPEWFPRGTKADEGQEAQVP